MDNSNKWLIVVIIIIACVVILLLIVTQLHRTNLFNPSRTLNWRPDVPFDEVFIWSNKNGGLITRAGPHSRNYIHIWHFNIFPGRKHICFCHGNSGTIAHRDYVIDFAMKFKFNLLLFDYQGYGRSSGKPDITSLYHSGLLAYRYLLEKCKPEDTIIWGESLGGAVATYVTAKYCKLKMAPFCLILMCTFSSIYDVVEMKYGAILASIFKFFGDLPSKDYILGVTCPVVILHSEDDEIIPYECSKILFNRISHPVKKLITISGTHASPIISEKKLYELFSFCHLDDLDVDPRDVKEWLCDLRNVAKKHGLSTSGATNALDKEDCPKI